MNFAGKEEEVVMRNDRNDCWGMKSKGPEYSLSRLGNLGNLFLAVGESKMVNNFFFL